MRVRRGDDGNVVLTYDLEAHYGKTYDMDHAPVVADFDNDGRLDVFVVGGYGISDPDTSNHGRAYALRAGEGALPEWPMSRYDLAHSACVDEAWSGARRADGVRETGLLSGRPNPFSTSTSIRYDVGAGGHVDLEIYDVTGRLVKSLVSGRKTPGTYSVSWDGTDDASRKLPSGIYFVSFKSAAFSSTSKMLLIR